MKERDFQTQFSHYLKSVYKQTGAFELKLCKGTALPFSSVVEHQVAALLAAKHSALVFKIPDTGYQNPFDVFCLSGVPAHVVIRYPDFWCMIDIDAFIAERDSSNRKSLTPERARAISTIVIE